MMYGLDCMVPIIEAYLKDKDVYDLIKIAERDFLLQSHEIKFILTRLGYKNNDGHWVKVE